MSPSPELFHDVGWAIVIVAGAAGLLTLTWLLGAVFDEIARRLRRHNRAREIASVPEHHRVTVVNVYAGEQCPKCHGTTAELNSFNGYFACLGCGERWTIPYAVRQAVLAMEAQRENPTPPTISLFQGVCPKCGIDRGLWATDPKCHPLEQP